MVANGKALDGCRNICNTPRTLLVGFKQLFSHLSEEVVGLSWGACTVAKSRCSWPWKLTKPTTPTLVCTKSLTKTSTSTRASKTYPHSTERVRNWTHISKCKWLAFNGKSVVNRYPSGFKIFLVLTQHLDNDPFINIEYNSWFNLSGLATTKHRKRRSKLQPDV